MLCRPLLAATSSLYTSSIMRLTFSCFSVLKHGHQSRTCSCRYRSSPSNGTLCVPGSGEHTPSQSSRNGLRSGLSSPTHYGTKNSPRWFWRLLAQTWRHGSPDWSSMVTVIHPLVLIFSCFSAAARLVYIASSRLCLVGFLCSHFLTGRFHCVLWKLLIQTVENVWLQSIAFSRPRGRSVSWILTPAGRSCGANPSSHFWSSALRMFAAISFVDTGRLPKSIHWSLYVLHSLLPWHLRRQRKLRGAPPPLIFSLSFLCFLETGWISSLSLDKYRLWFCWMTFSMAVDLPWKSIPFCSLYLAPVRPAS